MDDGAFYSDYDYSDHEQLEDTVGNITPVDAVKRVLGDSFADDAIRHALELSDGSVQQAIDILLGTNNSFPLLQTSFAFDATNGFTSVCSSCTIKAQLREATVVKPRIRECKRTEIVKEAKEIEQTSGSIQILQPTINQTPLITSQPSIPSLLSLANASAPTGTSLLFGKGVITKKTLVQFNMQKKPLVGPMKPVIPLQAAQIPDTRILKESILVKESSFAASFVKHSTTVSTTSIQMTGLNTSSDATSFKFDTPSPDNAVKQRRNMQNDPVVVQKKAAVSIAKRMQSMKIDPAVKREETTVYKSIANKKARKINVIEEFERRKSGKENINLVVVGHVDAGKSTLMGHLLYLLGTVDEHTLKRHQRESEKIKKSSFAFAWALDATDEERTRGITIDVAIASFETTSKRFTILDAPGHRDFIPNMISGASQADAALLVIDAQDFETGFMNGGQTREHALLLRSLGVSNVAVVLNKMEMVGWSNQRYDEVKEVLAGFLVKEVGFKKSAVSFVPCSGILGENIITRCAKELTWYQGPTLIELVDAFQIPKRSVEMPFRISIVDLFKGGQGGSNSVTISGRVESGTIQVGEQVQISPLTEYAVVKSIDMNGSAVKWAASGDNISIALTGIDSNHLSVGFIVCDPEYPVPVTWQFKAQIITFDLQTPLTIGVPVLFHHQSMSEPGFISKLESILSKSTGEVTKANPRALGKNVTAMVEITLQRPCCVELFSNSKILGRFTLRSGSKTVAAGVIIEIVSTGTRTATETMQ